jgi:hypothetical protein
MCKSSPCDVSHDLIAKSPNLAVIPFARLIPCRRVAWNLFSERAILRDPFLPSPIHDRGPLVSKELEHPKRVGRPPVVLVAIEDDQRIVRDPAARHQRLKAAAIDIVALNRVLEIDMPIDLDRAGDVSHFVQEDVLVRFGNPYFWIIQVILDPLGAHQHL